jgi:alpha-amylase/alpha-mannosidase (GH57 family)
MRKALTFLVVLVIVSGVVMADKQPLNLAIIWHQHQPLYWNRLTSEYELPWVRVHGVQEYIDSPMILQEFPRIHVAYNLQPSLLWQITDYAEITPQERAKGGLYQYIGAVDNHLRWIWTLINDPSSLSSDDRAKMQQQFFWINGYMFDDDTNDPYFDPRYAALNALKGDRPFTDQELLDGAGLSLLWEISPELHEALEIEDLRGKIDFTSGDIIKLIEAQHTVLTEVVSAYKQANAAENELITSPFYHPIVPLLSDHGWGDDVLGQITIAQSQHARLFDAPAVGVWPPEQAVSDETVRLFHQAGFGWTVTDQAILSQSIDHTPSTAELTTPWEYENVVVLFRDSDLSNRISFSYGNKPTQLAVDDFMGAVHHISRSLDDPGDHLLVIALDGENWMFMAGYPNNGRDFLRALYEALESDSEVRTVTPAEFLAAHPNACRPLDKMATGSWGGDLSTWIGEPEEDEAWAQLERVRNVVAAAGDSPNAISPIYAAEGSDWFWWYGSDQDSGTDDLFDWLFKAHLVAAYQAASFPEDKIPAVLRLRLKLPTVANLGEVKPTLDGRVTAPDEWADAVTFTGTGEIAKASIGYKEGSLYVMVKPTQPATKWLGEDLHLALYASGKSGSEVNVRTRQSQTQLGFGLASAINLNLAKVKEDGSGVVSRYAPDGAGGWRYASSIRTLLSRKAFVNEIVEFEVPFNELGIEPGQAITLALVLERSGELLAQAPSLPILARIPTLIQGAKVFSMEDPSGDDNGTGSYTYPKNSVFSEQGLFDLLRYSAYDSGDAWQLAFDFSCLPNPWNGPQGFSHPIIYLYLDIAEGGKTDSHQEAEAARVAFDPGHPWDVFIRLAGWPAYGRHLWTADGEGPYLVEVASDPRKGRVIVTVPKSLVPDIAGWHYVLIGSQDGYGKNYLRTVGKTAGEWTGGGCTDPQYAPQIYDYLAQAGDSQQEILNGYNTQEGSFATLIPVQIELLE